MKNKKVEKVKINWILIVCFLMALALVFTFPFVGNAFKNNFDENVKKDCIIFSNLGYDTNLYYDDKIYYPFNTGYLHCKIKYKEHWYDYYDMDEVLYYDKRNLRSDKK